MVIRVVLVRRHAGLGVGRFARLFAGLALSTLLVACGDRDAADRGDPGTTGPVATTAPGTPLPDPGPSTEAIATPASSPEKPALSITTLDGRRYDLAEHRGKWVVVNFWATWCAPCLKEMPELSALDAMHEHIEVVGLAYEDIEVGAMRDFLREHPVVYPVAIVDTYDPPADFDTPRGLPMTYLIAPDGTVASQVVGPVTAREIEAAIAAAGGPAADLGGAGSSGDGPSGDGSSKTGSSGAAAEPS